MGELKHDDDLERFEERGANPLPVPTTHGHVQNRGAQIWYADFGTGVPVVLLHGGNGHSGNWGYQVPALVSSGHHVIVVDSRGHGRSTRDSRPFTYELMASDVLAVLDKLQINEKAAMVGWSDGACVALILALQVPERVSRVFFFGCNMDPSGTREFKPSPVIGRCFARHAKDYARLSPTPDKFEEFCDAVGKMMQTEPNYSGQELAKIQTVPVAIVQSENDEFIKREHAEYLARSIPGAQLIILPEVSHFAPLQRPQEFNEVLLAFLAND
jgi:pimeloyl-ACP methyl ester carboxylesterase